MGHYIAHMPLNMQTISMYLYCLLWWCYRLFMYAWITAGVITNDGRLSRMHYSCTMHCIKCTLKKPCTIWLRKLVQNRNKAQQRANRVHISWNALYTHTHTHSIVFVLSISHQHKFIIDTPKNHKLVSGERLEFDIIGACQIHEECRVQHWHVIWSA